MLAWQVFDMTQKIVIIKWQLCESLCLSLSLFFSFIVFFENNSQL